VDFFKNYNDSYGHIEGDQCLKEIAHCFLTEFKRSAEVVARFGGEEFTVILPDVDQDEAIFLAHRLADSVRQRHIPHDSSPIENIVTISIGVATMHSNQIYESKDILKAADKALYEAKRKGRNRVEHTPLNEYKAHEFSPL
ncbi:MAG: GGDEF domain-containing protein, partial [Gammaproteobacteria bacterium]|nr:GGDEF domain-containing protein [Gammaproteobacteria bacterium]